ncbi:hypothetical protein [Paenibacillus dendritiformis]|uniref:hypothetical protein n=1 Tax=Paenibacillus dendritiformis TaxID=130049 RepID=UPI00387E16AF
MSSWFRDYVYIPRGEAEQALSKQRVTYLLYLFLLVFGMVLAGTLFFGVYFTVLSCFLKGRDMVST